VTLRGRPSAVVSDKPLGEMERLGTMEGGNTETEAAVSIKKSVEREL
jgi:hypothetical protein